MGRTKLVSRRKYDNRKAQFHAAQSPAAMQNPPPRIGNNNILNGRVRKRQFRIQSLTPQLQNSQVKKRGRVVGEMVVK